MNHPAPLLAVQVRFRDALDDLLARKPEVWFTRPVMTIGLAPAPAEDSG